MDVNLINVITLAYVGDAVYEVYVREYLIRNGIAKVEELQKEAVKYVSAKSQCKILTYLIDNKILTDIELDIVKRARNTNIHTKAKNYSIEEYRHATALEALLGFLYLSNQHERLKFIISNINIGEE